MRTYTSLIVAGFMVLFLLPVFIMPAFAQTPTPGTKNNGFFQELVQMISSKFGLNQQQVQDVVNTYKFQQRGKMMQNMADREKSRLDKLVKDGKITQAQEDAIIAEFKSLREKFDPSKWTTLTPEERKEKMTEMENELRTWAQSQGIDFSLITPGMGGGRIKNGMPWGRPHMRPFLSPTPTP